MLLRSMGRFFCVFVFILTYQISFGQQDTLKLSPSLDSTKYKVDSFQENVTGKADSITDPIKNSIRNNVLTDTVAFINSRVDSIQNEMNAKVDSLTECYTYVLTKIQTSAQNNQSKIDSLQSRKLPTDKYKAKIDSLSQELTKTQQDLNGKIEGIKKKATEKLKSISFPPELEDKVSKLTGSIGNLSPKTIEAKLPANLNLDKLNGLKNPLAVGNLGNVTNIDVPALPKINGPDQTGVPDLRTGVNDVKRLNGVSTVTGQAESAQGKIEGATKQLDPNSIDKLAETKASQLKEVKVLQEQTGDLPINPSTTQEEMKAKLKEQAKTVAVDHFAGKEQQLKAAMGKISKYKTKYSKVTSIREVAKRPPNAMHGKPLIERIVPGIGLQVQRKAEDLLVDFNPYVGYRFTGRITAGPGWNQRVAYSLNYYFLNRNVRIFGPRVFGEFRVGKGFSPRAELEVMNTRVAPASTTPTFDPESRQWIWGAFVGMKKEYRFIKRVKGTASIMTRLFDPHHKSPYAEVLNVRFGFEFPMKKKVKKITERIENP